MPRTAIDYSNTVFYKIYCKDARISDIYIGHTTNFIKRKNSHKSLVDNYEPYNDQQIYKRIRECGGWNNWNMIELEKCSCINRDHALKKELEYTLILKANLNSKPQVSLKTKEFVCQKCNNKFVNFIDYNNHLMECQKEVIENHKRAFSAIVKDSVEEMLTKTLPKYYCKYCNYATECVKDYNKHNKTKKHERNLRNPNVIEEPILNTKETIDNYREELRENINDFKTNTSYIIELIKENKELRNTLVEQTKTFMEQNNKVIEQNNKLIELSAKPNTTLIQNNNTTNNTTNNNSFNLNVFLNEQCKDAISITDFVDSLNLNVADLEATGKLGYVLGISRIFINKLKELDVYERPLHCTDYKRETVYIKNQDSWEKDNAEKTKLKHIVNRIARKNLEQLPAWQAENPDYVTLDTPENNEFMKISMSSLGGYTLEEENKQLDKIMRNVLKEVVVDKNAITEA